MALDATDLADTSFTANWDAVAGAASYLLAVSNNVFGVGGEPDFQFSQTVTGTSFTMDGLIPGTYYWRVRAVGNGPGP